MLTIIIASYNGQRTLPGVLEGYCRLAVPAGGWKIVFADNGSTDRSREIVEGFRARLPITVVTEPRRGKSRALLTALEHCEGDFVVFSDDDATPEPDWLMQLTKAAMDHPDFDIFGGAIRPQWEVPPELWIFEWVDLGACFAMTDPAQPEGPVAPNRVWGPNMAVRRKIFDQGYRFDPSIGPSGENYAMGDETDFNIRLGEAGFKSWFCPKAVVHHFVRAKQMNKEWIAGRATRFGRGMYRLQLLRTREHPTLLFGVPRHLYRQIAVQWLSYAASAVLGREDRYRKQWHLNYLRGCAIQAREFYASQSKAEGPFAGGLLK